MSDKKKWYQNLFNWDGLRSVAGSVGSVFFGKVVDAIFSKIVMPLIDWARSVIIVEKNKNKAKETAKNLKKAANVEDVSKDFRNMP